MLARTETTSSTPATTPKLTASCGVTPKRNFCSAPVSQKDATRPGGEAGAGDRQRLADDQADDVAHLRAERRAHADLARALRHGVRQHAEQADARDRQREGRERAEQHGVKPRPRQARRRRDPPSS